ncbi:NADPH:quinone oxidoreductase family protein [Myceligenerans xiligouense]|uniref:NADPH2:quinone reductase n=1 Tax=Myceligenerans xiligouense TaxID=253184 RepID=A0A3N4YH19_9MICO|nr:NADPH:quinone oxidoreductase family protein [Myceligenerans xiligouense]RPF20399.1 NADPH2:quinone reductase [Myceligenerans xiligouense]
MPEQSAPPAPSAPPVPARMPAWRVVANGEPEEVMELGDVEVPEPGPDEVLIRVRTVALNFPDVLLARGQYQVRPDLPFTPGIELCGEVAAVAPGVTRFAVGDRVVGWGQGALAAYAVLPATAVYPAPPGLDDVHASGLTIAYQTAWFGLHRRAALRPGETLLVHAAAGGVGSAACRLGAAAGAHVVGIVGSPAKVEAARAAGAHEVYLRDDDWVTPLRRRGADVVFDPVGGAAFEQSTKVIAFEGRIVVVGFASGDLPRVRPDHLLVKNYSVLGLHWGLYQRVRPQRLDEAHAELCRLVDDGVLRPDVSDVVPFEDAADGVRRLARGVTTGRIVVRVADDATGDATRDVARATSDDDRAAADGNRAAAHAAPGAGRGEAAR